eukprot:5295936-Amphidinium_carterae.1
MRRCLCFGEGFDSFAIKCASTQFYCDRNNYFRHQQVTKPNEEDQKIKDQEVVCLRCGFDLPQLTELKRMGASWNLEFGELMCMRWRLPMWGF